MSDFLLRLSDLIERPAYMWLIEIYLYKLRGHVYFWYEKGQTKINLLDSSHAGNNFLGVK